MSGNERARVRPIAMVEKARGASHKRKNTPCQDEVGLKVLGDVVAVAVADGHGTSVHGDVGARFAVDAALENLTGFAFDVERAAESMHLTRVHSLATEILRKQIARDWVSAVQRFAGTDSPMLRDYGSTLIFALATPNYVLIGRLGDGDVVISTPDDLVSIPIPPDPRAFADETPSLCAANAWVDLAIRVMEPCANGTLVFLSTDGLGKSYENDTGFQKVAIDYRRRFEKEGIDPIRHELFDQLSMITDVGSGDDIGVGFVYWPLETREPRVGAQNADSQKNSDDIAPPAAKIPASPESTSVVSPIHPSGTASAEPTGDGQLRGKSENGGKGGILVPRTDNPVSHTPAPVETTASLPQSVKSKPFDASETDGNIAVAGNRSTSKPRTDVKATEEPSDKPGMWRRLVKSAGDVFRPQRREDDPPASDTKSKV